MNKLLMPTAMTIYEPNKLTKWTISLSPSKTFWLFIFLFPMFTVWLRQVGLFTIKQNGRNDKTYNILSTFFVVASFILFTLGYGLLLAGHEIPNWIHSSVSPSLMLVWLILNGILCKNMIDYENRHDEYFYGFNRTMKEYMFRFFHLFYIPVSIYWLQKDVNQYLNSKSNVKK
jgi:uncharacterized Tic20 family protein